MALKLYSDSDIQSIADAIRGKNGSSDTYKVSQMASAISAIPTGGVTPTGTKQISITQNGTTTEDVTNYASAEITVNVPTGGGSYSDVLKALIDRTIDNLTFPSGLTAIGNNAFDGCSNLTSVTIPSGVTSIGNSAFSECKNLETVTIPSGVTSIGSNAFFNCQKLLSVELPSTVTGSIKNYTFQNCYLVPSIILPSGVTSIGVSAFNSCRSLTTLVLRRSDDVCALNNVNALASTPIRGYNNLTGTVYVPRALIDSYKSASNWSTIYSAGTVEFVAIEGSIYE